MIACAQNGVYEGLTICQTGPPGAGKTAFLKELKRRCDTKEFGDGKVHCIVALNSTVYAPGYVLAQFANQVDGFRFSEAGKKTLNAFNINIMGFGGGASWQKPASNSVQDSTFPVEVFKDSARKLIDDGHCFILAVDEAQGIQPPPSRKQCGLLANLHEGIGLPIVPLLLGLPNTQEKLQETISISRYAYGNEPFMVGLSDEESKEYVMGMFDHLGAEGSNKHKHAVCDWLVEVCGGWPHHLSNGMKAVAEGLLAADSPSLNDINGELVATSLTERRLRYYQSRMESKPTLEDSRAAIGELLGKLPKPIFKLRDAMREALTKHEPKSNIPFDQLLDELKQSGIVAKKQKEKGGVEWVCPIECMGAYVANDIFETKPFPILIREKAVIR